MMARTQEEIKKLKESWMHDPNWDIEDTEGFEDHVEELLNFRRQTEEEWEAKSKARREARAEKVRLETGVADELIVQSLHTFSEIEFLVYRSEEEVVMLRAQVYATLLQSAQMKRIADALEFMAEGDALSGTVKIWREDRE